MSYLFPFIYLFLNSMTRIVIEGREVLIQKKGELWKVSTAIFEGEVPSEILKLKWQDEGKIEIDEILGTVYWVQKIHPSNFGKEFPAFLKSAQEWSETLKCAL